MKFRLLKKNFFLFFLYGLVACSHLEHRIIENERSSILAEEQMSGNSTTYTSVIKIRKKSKATSSSISGLCFVVDGREINFDFPCVGVEILFYNEKEEKIDSVFTDNDGKFSILNLEKDKFYSIKIKSGSYDMLSEQVILRTGAAVVLRLLKK